MLLINELLNFLANEILSIYIMVESMLYVGSNLIKNAITDDIKKWNIQVTETKAGTPDNGFDCIEHGVMCLADCRDTVYPFSMEILKAEIVYLFLYHNRSILTILKLLLRIQVFTYLDTYFSSGSGAFIRSVVLLSHCRLRFLRSLASRLIESICYISARGDDVRRLCLEVEV